MNYPELEALLIECDWTETPAFWSNACTYKTTLKEVDFKLVMAACAYNIDAYRHFRLYVKNELLDVTGVDRLGIKVKKEVQRKKEIEKYNKLQDQLNSLFK